MGHQRKKSPNSTGARVGIVVAIVAAVAALAMIPARAAGGGPDIVESYQGPGYVFDPTKWSPMPALGGQVEGDAVRVTVALQEKSTGLWWQPSDTCDPGVFLTCGDGVLGQKWEKNDAWILDGLPGEDLTYSFQLLPPDGTYMVGIKAYDANGNTGRNIWQEIRFETSEPTPQSVSAALEPPLPANTFNEGRVVLSGGLSDHNVTTLVGVYNRDLGKWVDPDGDPLSAKQRFEAELGGDDFFGFRWESNLDLPAGRYAYGADIYDANNVRIDNTPWTYFTVLECSVRCANVSLTSAVVSFEDGGVCFSVESNANRVRLALRNDTTGEWLTGSPLTFGQSWGQFNNLGTILQAGPDSKYSCYDDAPLDLPAGDYHLGVKTYDGANQQGPKAWFGFTVR